MACLIYRGLMRMWSFTANHVSIDIALNYVDPLLVFMEDHFDVAFCEAAGCH